MSDDPWDAFGGDDSDDSDDDSTEQDPLVQVGITFLTQQFVRQNPQIPMARRIVQVSDHANSNNWKEALTQRGLKIDDALLLCDAAVVTNDQISPRVVPGGYMLLVVVVQPHDADAAAANDIMPASSSLHRGVWNVAGATKLCSDDVGTTTLWAIQRWACPINSTSCPWKPNTTNLNEQLLLQKATITKSAYELLLESRPRMSSHTTSQAVQALSKYGYCVIRSALDPKLCEKWGQAVLSDLHAASEILLERDQIDLYRPHDSMNDPQSYQELSMREDLRMDLRDGPCLRQVRAAERQHCGSVPLDEADMHRSTVVTNTNQKQSKDQHHQSCLRFHPDVLAVVKQALNPASSLLYKGNFGRYNFDGSGPDGSPQPLRIGPMGGIVSLPQSADQAIHADTPHLFETHDCLPPHYVNAFCLGAANILQETDEHGFSTGDTPVGGTAFVHASHKLSFTARFGGNWSATTEPQVLLNLVRPSLEIGDLVLFDCRILHFGLANTSTDVERPMLYINMMQAWFHDPKNWDDRETIFPTT